MTSVPEQQAAVSTAQNIVKEADTKFPDAPEASDDLVSLPGGLLKKDQVIDYAQVRELTGEHEEKLVRASVSGNSGHFLSLLLECGTVRIGEEPEEKTEALLKDLLVGDRDALLLGIRVATYGPEVKVSEWPCPMCGKPVNLTLDLTDDVPLVELKDRVKDREFEVKLRKGGVAKCVLLTGHEQEIINADPKMSRAERKTLMVSKTVRTLVDPDGKEHQMDAWPSLAKKMGMADREAVVSKLDELTPGPRYNSIKFTHEECGKEVVLALTLGDLFLI